MAKLALLIPMPNIATDIPQAQVFWMNVFRTNDSGAFVREMEHYLIQAVSIRVNVKDLTAGEAQHLKSELQRMHDRVNIQLIQKGYPVLSMDFGVQMQKVIDGSLKKPETSSPSA